MMIDLTAELKAAQKLPRGSEEEELHCSAVNALEDRAISAIVHTPASTLADLVAKLDALEFVAQHVLVGVEAELVALIRSAASDARRLG